jgi:FixJ family two-component response regulator
MIEPEIIIECMKAGALDYIMKPYELDKVLRSLEIALHKRQ